MDNAFNIFKWIAKYLDGGQNISHDLSFEKPKKDDFDIS